MANTLTIPIPPMTAAPPPQAQNNMGYISPITVNTTAATAYTIGPTSNRTINASPLRANSTGMSVTGTVTASDFVINGSSIKETLEKIQERLAILVPDPHKLEKFAALKAAYEHYQLLEKLCTEP